MRKLKIMAIAGAICTLIFLIHNNLAAQSSGDNSCELVKTELEGYEIWEENTNNDCWRCELDTEPEAIYDQFGNYIGLLYRSIRINAPVDEIVCGRTDNPEDFCEQKLAFPTSNDECHDVFVPDGQ